MSCRRARAAAGCGVVSQSWRVFRVPPARLPTVQFTHELLTGRRWAGCWWPGRFGQVGRGTTPPNRRIRRAPVGSSRVLTPKTENSPTQAR